MTASRPARAPHNPGSPESHATAFWAYIQAQAPHFTLSSALDLVAALRPLPADPKVLAKRVRESLQRLGISIKHMSALQAASRLQGASSWYAQEAVAEPLLRFFTIDDGPYEGRQYLSWNDITSDLRDWADRIHSRGQLPLGVLRLTFTEHAVELGSPQPVENPDQMPSVWMLATITCTSTRERWLAGAAVVFGKLRRHLEENHHAVLDGHAALDLCARSRDLPGDPGSVGIDDVANTELVLFREDDEDLPNQAYEIARGNEMTCWHQMELSLRGDGSAEVPKITITVPTEGVGAWLANGVRYVWMLETLKPREYVPGLTQRQIGIGDCERLLRRYLLAKRVQGEGFKYHEQTKSVEYLSHPPQVYRVNLHRVLHILKDADLTWESYCEHFGEGSVPMQDTLPIGFVFNLLRNLKVEKFNSVFATPNLSEMSLAENDALLRALMPRVQAVTYSRPRDLNEHTVKELREAVDAFGDGLRMQMMAASRKLTENELPYLVYAYEPAELLAKVSGLGLKMYAAVIPHLLSTKGLLPESPDVWPWASGNALFLRFEHPGGAA
ncbi:hypothetical protein [Burkholderia cepacia]|uniref:hypothetical protein n=1 Tax=Burkholderia cepacia TaxID=292 RepID=UPI001C935463|nr:hypothetical protein [Burkholderia cepacia]MBY4714900.1 hypothetical protein [Burkholderia cepacia]MBY4739007.1 hypothetical protein [Burkholderia cepacia]MBY4744072.1 hypothetical protein [Burkholderia cepacia]MBY4757057.1 hypothetical protein [Burkholderia cepacia]MBY4777079.1 hypothetical protein [Burkholderia cepacia]